MGRPTPAVALDELDPAEAAGAVGAGPTGELIGRALLVFGASRLLTAVLIAVAAAHQVPIEGMGADVDYWDMVGLWDARWYEAIADGGYPGSLDLDADGVVVRPLYAFSPLFPLLARWGMAATGASFAVVGSTIALAAGLGAAVVVATLLRPRVGARAALWSVALVGAFPAAPVLQIAYADSLGLLLVAGFLLAIDRGRWWAASALAVAIGFTRPLAPPLLAVVAAAAWERWRRRDEQPVRAREAVAVASCAAAVVVGNLAWAAYAWARTGVRSAYLDSQAAWWHGPSFRPFELWRGSTTDVLLLGLVLAFVVAACVSDRSGRLGLPMRAWCVAYVAFLAVVGGNVTPTIRHLLLLFPMAPVLLGAAGPAATAGRRDLTRRGALLVGAGAIGAVAWVWVLLRYTPPSDYAP